jgi:tetratricopeptide (TPR) repeat protein
MWRVALVLVTGLVLAVAGWAGVKWLARIPEPPVPPETALLDPAVVALVDQARVAVHERPRDAATWGELGMVYEANGMPKLSLECYRRAVVLRKREPRWWYRLALVQARLGSLQQAVAAVDRVIELETSYAPAHWRRGLWLLEQGELQAAEAAFRKAIEIDPKDTGGWLGLARVHLEREENEQAIRAIERVLIRRTDPYVHQLLGTAYRQAGRLEDARREFALATGHSDPRYAWAVRTRWPDPWEEEVGRYRRGFASDLSTANRAYASGRGDAAIPELERLCQQRPEDVPLLNNLGVVYITADRLQDAVAVLTRAAKLDAQQFAVRLNLAWVHHLLGNSSDALEHVNHALELNPKSGKAYETKGKILAERGSNAEAIEAFRQAWRYDARDVRLLVRLGMLQLDEQRWQDALASFDEATLRDPASAEAHVGRGIALLQLGELDRAEAALQRADELASQDRSLLNSALKDLRARRREAAATQTGDGE